MTQAYGAAFAKIYNQRWAKFAEQAAPLIRQFYETTPVGRNNRAILDLCCGAGQLARHFLDSGYHVTGIDLSEAMLEHARKNNLPYLVADQARFQKADAANFTLDEKVGLVVSTFDALNHLPNFAVLKNCFNCVFASLIDQGIFIFDLNTVHGLKDRWTGVMLEDTPEFFLLNRGIWIDESQRAYTRIVGFQRLENGLYERFEETAYNTAFDLHEVRQALVDCGFKQVNFARLSELAVSVDQPEAESRVFFLAFK